jgi:hypothetical protein
MNAHVICHRTVAARQVLIGPPRDALTIPIPATLVAEHAAGDQVYACDVTLLDGRHARVLPTWVQERQGNV